MDAPQPADGWPDGPLSTDDARALYERRDAAEAVWVMDPESGVRSVTVPADGPDEPVVDIVVETDDAFEMYSYTGGRWMDYGTQQKDDEEAPPMAGTLESYRVLAGASPAYPNLDS